MLTETDKVVTNILFKCNLPVTSGSVVKKIGDEVKYISFFSFLVDAFIYNSLNAVLNLLFNNFNIQMIINITHDKQKKNTTTLGIRLKYDLITPSQNICVV